jgi:hypothetical protein
MIGMAPIDFSSMLMWPVSCVVSIQSMEFRHVPIHSFFKLLPGNNLYFRNRESFHLNGFIVCDCGGVENIMTAHNYTKHAQEALDEKTIVESDIDQALERTYGVLV